MYQVVKPKIERGEVEGNHGCFVIQPLERGFGTTLGNSLRRVLLAALPGAAVTQVRINGVPHEFSVVPHMREDAIDFILNLKGLRIRPLGNREGTLSLNVEGEGYVCAADIMPSADFEIANPELHLATLDSDEAKLDVELTVELGKGYLPASHGDGVPRGVIPIDAIFTPVTRVSYTVEQTRLGQQTGYEKLTMEIWTDSTVQPADAMNKAAQILMDQLSALTVTAVAADEEEKSQATPSIPSALYEMGIDQIGLSQSIIRRLRRNKITKLGELLEKSREELLALEKFGARSAEEVEKCVQERGFALRGSEKKEKDDKETVEELEIEPEEDASKVMREGDEEEE
ncbi:MAG: DNA-directed RNA polymerase subunit alpha [Chloroflexota bacterium]|nr:DNA-directed RNA polymerase subunit alpha [Chloroflexota bacterium]